VDLTTGAHRLVEVADPGSWFGPADPEHEYQAEIGRWDGGRFEVAARSNVVRTPRRRPATLVDEEWVPTAAEEAQLRAIAGQIEFRREPGYGAHS
jgi:hypothetical protein